MANSARWSSATFTSTLRGALLPAAVTVLVFLPEFFRDPADAGETPTFTLIWAGVLLLAAPVTAYAINRRVALATDALRSLLIAAPQLPLLVLLSSIDVWLDVRSGYLLAGSGEEAMAYGIGTTVAGIFGLILAALVALAAHLGARRSHQQRPHVPNAG